MQAVRDTMAQNFPQIRIDYQIAVDFASFIRIIDTLGGIDVDVTEAFHYDEAVSVDGGVEDFPAYDVGIEHMNGQRALYYSRYRGGIDGDLGRIRRQQQVMLAVAQHVVALDAFGRAPDLWARFKDAVDTDVPAFRVPGIALLTKQIGLDRIVMRSLGEVTREVITDGGADVLVATPTDMARVVAGVFADPRLRQEAAVIEVQNAAGRNGLATATATYLSQKGLAAADISVTTATQGMAEETVVYNLHGKDFTTRQIADWLGLPSSRVRFLNDPAVAPLTRHADVLVVLGRDARAPQLPSIPDSSGNLSPAPRTLQGALPSGN